MTHRLGDSSSNILSRCLLLNARSLNKKLPEFHNLLRDDFSLIFITESWLSAAVTNAMLDSTGNYTIYRKDRPGKRGGGVIGMVSNNYNSYTIPLPSKFDMLEIVVFCIVTKLGTFRYIVVYRPPDYNQAARDYMKLLCQCLEFLCNTRDTVVLVGDFNLPGVNWALMDSPDDSIHSAFLEFCIRFGLNQFVTEPTHDKNCLDLVLSSDKLIISDLSVSCPFSCSDHCMVNFNLLLTPHETENSNAKCFYDFDNADFESINTELFEHPFNNNIVLAESVDNVCVSDTADDVWCKFVSPLNAALDKFVPVKNFSSNNKSTSRKYPRHILRVIKRKLVLWRLFRRDPSVINKANYKGQAALCKKLILDYERSRELSVINKSNLGSFYRFVNKKLTCKSGVGPLRLDSNTIITNDEEKANLLNSYFSSVFTVDDGMLPPFVSRVPNDVSLKIIHFTPGSIVKAIKCCKGSRSLDPDGYSNFVIKQLLPSLVSPLCVLFNHVFNAGCLPSAWKTANITPIFKKGVSSSVSNYRPISLTSVFCKLFERIVKEQMLKYLLDNKLISKHQHGFLAMHSTSSQLLEAVNDWTISIKNSHVTDAIYFDYAKAFDSVSHVKLLYKVKGYGIDGQLLTIITNFLSSRVQRVILPNGVSSFASVTSGVPQGSVLGPLLFLLYINDVCDIFNGTTTKIKLYADDIKMYLEIANDLDTVELQRSIDHLAAWSETWQLSLSVGKCFHIRYGLTRNTNLSLYNVNGFALNTVTELRDLGVMMDSKLNFTNHVTLLVSRGHLRANQILRCFISNDRILLTKAFTTYVRPLLEYCSSVWNPHQITLINKIESVQRWFTKRLVGMSTLSYDQRCQQLGLERLELRRLHADLLCCFCIIHGLNCLSSDDFFTLSDFTITRGHTLKLALPKARVDCRKFFFCVRIIKVWNSLPNEIVTLTDAAVFKINLKSINLSAYIVGKM